MRSRQASAGSVIGALIAFACLGAWLAHVAVDFPGDWDPDRFQTVPDAAADWLAAQAAVDGIDPYLELDELGALYEVPVDPLPEGASNPRFPGGLLFLLPLLTVSVESVVTLMTGVNLISLALSGWLLWRWWGTAVPALTLPVLAATPPFVELVAHGPHVGVMTLALVAAWLAAACGRQWTAGLATAALGLVRGFPLLLIPALWKGGRVRAAAVGLGAFVVVNLVGMAVFDIGFREAISGLSEASAVFGTDVHNSSAAGMLTRLGVDYGPAVWLGGVMVVAAWGWALMRGKTVDDAWLVTVPAMLLASPLSWPTYQYLLLPVIAVMALRRETRLLLTIGLVALGGWIWWVAAGVAVSGVATFILYSGVGVAAAVSNERRTSAVIETPDRLQV